MSTLSSTHGTSSYIQRKQTLLLQSYHTVMELDAHYGYQRTTNFMELDAHYGYQRTTNFNEYPQPLLLGALQTKL